MSRWRSATRLEPDLVAGQAGSLVVHGPDYGHRQGGPRNFCQVTTVLLKESGEDGPWILFHLPAQRLWISL